MKTFAIILCLFIIQMVVIFLLEFRRPQRTVAWLFILLCCPPLGLLFYYYFGSDYRQARNIKRRGTSSLREIRKHVECRSRIVKKPEETGNPEFDNQRELLLLLSRLSENPITGRNQSRVLFTGIEAYDSMLEAMESAQEHIHVEFYIFREDKISQRFKEVMLRKARQGVKVRLLCDGIGSHSLSRKFINTLKKGGVEFHFFLPPLLSFLDRRSSYRNHRKIVIVDGLIGFTGGMNVGDDYLGHDPEIGYWRDTHLQLEGDAVYFIQFVFLKDWRRASGERLSHPRLFPVHSCEGSEAVQIVESGPDLEVDSAQELYFAAMCAAKHRIWITTPYFIPDSAICRALKSAVLRGVDVRVLIPGKPDTWLVYYASLSYLEDLQDAGVKFYRYQKGFIHSKVILIDQLLASVGSANLDMRSLYSNFELTAVLMEPERIAKVAAEFEQDLKNSDFIDPHEFKNRSRFTRLKENLCYLLSPLL
ncbi:cardiolipin synthase [Paenibacillus sp. BR2-3]|uniref:cardiolipin synthase n=1 Tax=Paenibacillus sp. BR2-3 TaxID=3048494 RepID=UPI0039772952